MEITPKTNINALLKAYPQLEAYLMQLHPKYKKLKNPVLRRTVGRIATLTQVAMVGGFDVTDLVNRLRAEVGQPPLVGSAPSPEPAGDAERPAWSEAEPAAVIDAVALLEAEKNPLAEASRALKALAPGEVLRIDSDFLPAPLIDTFTEQGHAVHAIEEGPDLYRTYVRKK
jgi:TusA-related sulfurtransferase